MEESIFLPVGTVLRIHGSVKKLMIIARGALTNVNGIQKYFDYGACTYPEGLIGNTMIYFNKEDVNDIVQLGYEDEDEKIMVQNLEEAVIKLKTDAELAQRAQ